MLKRIASFMLVSLLVACGGGGGNAGSASGGTTGGGGSPAGTSQTATLLLSISTTTATATAPALVSAALLDATGAPVVGQVVSFATNGGLGAFNVNSALTNSSGIATAQLSPASPSSNGADLVIAKATIASVPLTGTIGFQVSATSAQPVGTPSLSMLLSTTSVTTAAPADVTVTLKDAAGNALPGQVVKLSSIDGLGAFNPPSALTDSNGLVTVKLSPSTATTKGADLAVATAKIGTVTLTATAGFSALSAGAPATGTPSIALSLSSSLVTVSTPATVVAVVKDSTGAAVVGQVVKFSTVDGLGTFTVNSALTDAVGQVSVVLSAVGAGRSGADQVVARVTVNGTPLQASQGFQLTASGATIASFTSDIGAAQLAAYGQTTLTANVVGAPAGTTVNLAVSSACAAKGKATLTPASASTSTGVATFTYRDIGCGATDASDSIQVSIVGTSTARALSVTLTPPTVSSITFTSATPQTIYLKGSGLTETSTVIFTVVDTAGFGLPNQSVTLEPTTLSGGLTLDGGSVPVTKLSDSQGQVRALINSGTVPTPVRIKATLNGATTVSSALSVAVGLPSQLNFSISQTALNIEGYDIDGTTNAYSIIASDRLSNPVPAGTSINFIAEGGQVEPIKTTTLVNGLARASANFVSASPRPLDGRITVLAYALGEESFLDTNGDNVWNSPPDTQFQDLGSVFLSRKFLNTYFSATDQLIPLALPGPSSSAVCRVSSSQLLALDKSIPTVGDQISPTLTCDGAWGRAYVRRAAETVLSTSSSRPIWFSAPAGLYAAGSCPRALDVLSAPAGQNLIIGYAEGTGAEVRSGTLYTLGGGTTLYGMPLSSVFSFLVADTNRIRLNPVAAGSSITVSATDGIAAVVEGGSPVPSSAEATFASVKVTFTPPVTDGAVTIRITSPGGLTTVISQGVSTRAAAVAAPPSSVPCL